MWRASRKQLGQTPVPARTGHEQAAATGRPLDGVRNVEIPEDDLLDRHAGMQRGRVGQALVQPVLGPLPLLRVRTRGNDGPARPAPDVDGDQTCRTP